jgi:uncharacterized protein (DUF305 family)
MNNNQNNKALYIIGGIIIGLLLTAIFTPVMRYGGMMFQGNTSYAPSAIGINSIDQHFIEQMIPHHEGAITMANLALQKAKHQEIKTLATAIIAAQTTEIQSMNGWYKDWFGNTVPNLGTGLIDGGMMSQNGMHMGGQEDMTALENASDFDKTFIEEMIPHHQLAIMMASMLQSGTNRPEMQQLAKNIIESQSNEIEKMRGWYSKWYK